MPNNIFLKDISIASWDFVKKLDSAQFYTHLRKNTRKIQAEYIRRTMNLLNKTPINELITKLGNKIEILVLVDENDQPYRNNFGQWSSEFRQDYMNYDRLPESKERMIFCRITLSLLEDSMGNIVVSRRSPHKSHPNMLELSGGHVSVWYWYLETCIKELDEELQYTPSSLWKPERLFKYREIFPDKKPWVQGRWYIVTTYRVKIPWAWILRHNTDEITELITMTPNELLDAIRSKNKDYLFEQDHAYFYLEYLKSRLPAYIDIISQGQANLSHNLTQLDTFPEEERQI